MGKDSLVKDEERYLDQKDFREVDKLVDIDELDANMATLLDTGRRGAESTGWERWILTSKNLVI